jgi:hypothetical protein
MSLDNEQRIRDRAYAIWLEQGCPEGCDYEHWLIAEQEVAGASGSPAAPKAASEKTGAKKAGDKAAKAPAAERKPRARKAAVTA